ncbi:uncharacterized protein B0T15DRAFT_106596 [Chaetomium strumarium]|uniref:Uncharacterized protein n=1 Tax=Chaetomium strumarium TaxID=1170767 RepID=A0AAJ0GY81_9PEZI|nr:hypothetical protein B0T15DRAFT_106596 [Chaetomium strumarium]
MTQARGTPAMDVARSLQIVAVLLSLLSIGAAHHIPARLSRPIFAPDTLKRATSQDPSCPDGFLCLQQPCPSSAICAAGEMCLNFEGTLACVPQGASFCALNPSSFEGVGCWNGMCWFVPLVPLMFLRSLRRKRLNKPTIPKPRSMLCIRCRVL